MSFPRGWLNITSATVQITGGTFTGDGDLLAATTTGTGIEAPYFMSLSRCGAASPSHSAATYGGLWFWRVFEHVVDSLQKLAGLFDRLLAPADLFDQAFALGADVIQGYSVRVYHHLIRMTAPAG